MMKIVLVGHGKMGRMVESLARRIRLRGGRRDRPAVAGARRRTRTPIAGAASMSRSISRSPDAVMTNAPMLARRGISLVVGTTGWAQHEAQLRQVVADAGVGIVVAPNFSTGVVLFEAIVAHAARLFAAQSDFGAFLHEAHHAAKKDAPSGTALLLKQAMEQAGFPGRSMSRRRAPASFPARTRSASTARPKRSRCRTRRATGRRSRAGRSPPRGGCTASAAGSQ